MCSHVLNTISDPCHMTEEFNPAYNVPVSHTPPGSFQ